MGAAIKILIHGMTENPGGMESFIMNYYRNINSERIQFDFVCVNKKLAHYQEIIDRGSKVFIISGRKKYITQCRQLASIFTDNKYDGFWSNRCNLSGTIPFFRIASKKGVPLRILHAHNSKNMFSFISGIFHKIEKHFIKKYVTDFWSCSDVAGSYFFDKNTIFSTKYKIINNAIDISTFRFDEKIRSSKRRELKIENNLVIGHIGRFNQQKNHAFLIRIFNEIYKREPNAVLLLAGDGELRLKIEQMVKSLNLSNVVFFLGIRSDIAPLLNAIDMFVYPSRFEGLSAALIEAQATSLNVFTSTNVSSETTITDLLSFIDLQKSPKNWADVILAKREYIRKDMANKIREAGYDIKTEAEKIESFLCNR